MSRTTLHEAAMTVAGMFLSAYAYLGQRWASGR